MGSEDDFHSKNPQANEWMTELDAPVSAEARASALAKLSATPGAARRLARRPTVLSGLLQRLARATGSTSEELAELIPADTIRRTKFPVRERKMPDGTTLFEHDLGIIEGARALVRR